MTPVTRNLLFQRRQKRRVRRMAWCLAMSPAGAVGRSVPWDAGRSAGVQSWQDCAAMRSRAAGHDKMLAKCVPQRSTVARCCRSVFSGGDPWQLFRFMRSRRGLGREKRPFLAAYRRRASEMSRLRQDIRAMHPKSPANSRLGIHRAKILPGRGPFRCAGPSDHARRADLATPRRRRTAPGRQADAICRSPSDTRGTSEMPQLQWHPWRSFPADAPRPAAFPATQANIETRRALAVVHWAESACHQHFVNAKSTAIFEHDNTRLKAAIPPKPRQHVHRFAVHAPHFAIFRPVVHVCILEQVFV